MVMKTLTAIVVIAALLLPTFAAAQQTLSNEAEAAAYKQMAAGIPLGSRIKVHTTDGRRRTATLMAVNDQGIVVKRESRVPEPALSITYVEITRLQLDDKSGFSIGKAVGVGLAAGVGAI